MEALAAAHPDLVRTEVIGHSVQGREIVAARVTGGGAGVPEGARPAVLYLGLQHAREWIAGEVTRRLLLSVVNGYGVDPDTTKLLDSTELWFLPVANPDGYELTFERATGCGARTWPTTTWTGRSRGGRRRHQPESSRPLGRRPDGVVARAAALNYRGPAAASEPETKALVALASRLRFRFIVNYHSFGKLLLYPIGWQDRPRQPTMRSTPRWPDARQTPASRATSRSCRPTSTPPTVKRRVGPTAHGNAGLHR